MLDHNEHHAEELVGVAEKLKDAGFPEPAKEIMEGVECFKQGNAKLAHALEVVEAHVNK